MTPNDATLERIRKLLALANNNPSEEEAALAMAKVQEMCAAYNLELTELESKSKVDYTKPEHERVGRKKETYQRSALFDYQRKLWEALAKANFCWYEAIPVYKTNTLGVRLKANYHHYFIGREANIITTKLMGEYLEEVLVRLCPHRVGKPMFYWKEGAASRLVERLEAKRYEMERESAAKAKSQAAENQSTGIVLASVYVSEDDLNYRFVHGEDAYERRMAYKYHDRKTCVCPHCVKDREFWARYESEKSTAVEKPETDAQRRRREEREAKANQRYWDAWERKQERERRRKDMGAYNQGRRDAEDISLDQQLGGGNKGRLK